MIKRVSRRSRQRGKARVIGRVCLTSAPLPGPAFWTETMILVAGLAAAGLVGIAAAFYFSMRTGNGGYRSSSRRFSGAGRSRAEGRRNAAADDWAANDHRAADNSRSVNTKRGANAGRPANAGRAGRHASGNYRGEAHTGPNTAVDFGGLVSGPPAGRPGEAPGDPRSADAAPPVTPTPLAAFGLAAADPGAAAEGAMGAGPAKEPKSRRRMGWRKGTDIDEEMWPTEAFGGLSDDQFWDDLASDKPLTTTARTAHQDSGARNRPPVPADHLLYCTFGDKAPCASLFPAKSSTFRSRAHSAPLACNSAVLCARSL